MGRYNVLITGTGGCGVGEGLYKSLQPITDYNLFACNNSDNSLFLFNRITNSFIIPSANHPNYIDYVLNICLENKINIVIPGSEQELITLIESIELFTKKGIIILSNTYDIIKTFDNKWETFLKLSELGIKTPDTTLSIDDQTFLKNNHFPYIIKPIIGNASKNVFIVNNHEELLCISKYMKLKGIPFILQEYIGSSNDEYTISVISDINGNYLGSIVLKRILSGGFSQYIICEDYNDIDIQAIEISNKLLSKGPLNIQCRIVNGLINVFEINPRFSGTSPFRALLGFNEADILIKKILENKTIYDKSKLKINYFGVRGFIENVYPEVIKSTVKSFV